MQMIFTAPGEMATRCREFDWASTPLGPIESWSQSLRTMADAVISSRNPMLLFWGPSMIQLYNDAFRPSLGAEDGAVPRHPRALGMSARHFWVDVWAVVGPMLENVLQNGEAVWYENTYLPIMRAQGQLEDAWWTYSYSPVRDDNDEINGVLVVCQETTQFVKSVNEISRARVEAEFANRAKSDFLAVMSHELRTPLNAIDGYAELLEAGIHGELNTSQTEFVSRIRRSERHLLGLINEVLEYTKIEAGTISYDVEEFQLSDVLRLCDEFTMPQRDAKKLALHQEFVEDAVVRADREKLQQVVLNILSNAIKFTDVAGSITMRLEIDNDTARLTIADTGKGIPAHQLVRIFEPFAQVDTKLTRTNKGIGLGLAISRELARGMGGDIVVASTVGEGSEFTLSIPLATPSIDTSA